jgi:hypothetical protein
MKIHIEPAALKRTKWHEYAVRFLFGGLITAIAGLIAKRYGPGVAGLFLAFPAIFPASATLIEKHETEKQRKAGLHGHIRGRTAAGVEAAGTAMGCLGLLAFAAVVWQLLPVQSLTAVLAEAMAAWIAVSVFAWILCEQTRKLRQRAKQAAKIASPHRPNHRKPHMLR